MFPHPDPAPRTKVPVPYKATRAVLRVRTSSLWGHFPAPYTFVLPHAMPGVCSCHVEGGLTPGEEGVRALKAPVSADAGRAPDSAIIPAPPAPSVHLEKGARPQGGSQARLLSCSPHRGESGLRWRCHLQPGQSGGVGRGETSSSATPTRLRLHRRNVKAEPLSCSTGKGPSPAEPVCYPCSWASAEGEARRFACCRLRRPPWSSGPQPDRRCISCGRGNTMPSHGDSGDSQSRRCSRGHRTRRAGRVTARGVRHSAQNKSRENSVHSSPMSPPKMMAELCPLKFTHSSPDPPDLQVWLRSNMRVSKEGTKVKRGHRVGPGPAWRVSI